MRKLIWGCLAALTANWIGWLVFIIHTFPKPENGDEARMMGYCIFVFWFVSGGLPLLMTLATLIHTSERNKA